MELSRSPLSPFDGTLDGGFKNGFSLSGTRFSLLSSDVSLGTSGVTITGFSIGFSSIVGNSSYVGGLIFSSSSPFLTASSSLGIGLVSDLVVHQQVLL